MSDQHDDEAPKVLGDNAGVYVPGVKVGDLTVDFGGFIVGLYQSALMSMGEIEHPDMPAGYKDLESAKHTIDILKLLQYKTQNNLDEEEASLLKGLLYKLHTVFIDAQKS